MPHVAVVKQLDYDPASSTATVERELEGGLVEVLRVRTPALLTIQTGINEPRYANLRAIKQAREKPLEVTTPDELGVDSGAIAAAAGSRRRELATPSAARGAEMIDGSPAEVAARIVEIVREQDERMSGVLVVAETRRGELREVSLELISAALAVKDAAGGRVAVAVIDHEPQRFAPALSADGVDELLLVADAAASTSRRTSPSARSRS